jgi:hypothetical protein
MFSLLVDHNRASHAVLERTLPRALLAALRRPAHVELSQRRKRCGGVSICFFLVVVCCFCSRAIECIHASCSPKRLVLSRKGEPALQRWADRARGNWCVRLLLDCYLLFNIGYCFDDATCT